MLCEGTQALTTATTPVVTLSRDFRMSDHASPRPELEVKNTLRWLAGEDQITQLERECYE